MWENISREFTFGNCVLEMANFTEQFVIFNPWKVPWNWMAFYQNSFVISPGSLYHLIRRDSGQLANEAFTSNPIVSLKQWLNSLKITNVCDFQSMKSAVELNSFLLKFFCCVTWFDGKRNWTTCKRGSIYL